MNKNKRLLILIGLLLIVAYIGFKSFCYLKYKESDNLEITNIKFNGSVNINHVLLNDDDYIVHNNIKFKNIFDGYERINEETNAFKMVKKENDNSSGIFIGKDEQFLDILLNNKEYKGVFNKIAKRENIQNDLDLLKYMEKHNDDKVSFFMTTKKQKEIYTVNLFKEVMLPSISYVKQIDGYFTGYIFRNNKSICEVNVLKDNMRYYFTFIGDYDEEFINSFMNSVIIE